LEKKRDSLDYLKRKKEMSDLIMGKNAIKEVLKYKPKALVKVYVTESSKDPLVFELEKKNILIEFVSKQNLFSLVKSDSHQGFVAKITGRYFIELKEFLSQKKENSLVLMLDNINDPQNFGSILRSCECFNVDAVIWSKNRGVDLTPSAAKASAGGSEFLTLIRVSNLAESLKRLKDEGYAIVITDVDPKSESICSFKFPSRMVLVMGSEGEGIQPLIKKLADYQVHIPMFGKLESLNVSQSAAIILSQIKQTSG
jgi:23S rRNA (guanosine2251-2'-O)-methyltransferase